MNFKLFLFILVVLIVIDIIYLSFIADYMNKVVRNIQGKPIKLEIISVILIYLFISLGLYYFIIIEKRPVLYAFLLGIIIYGVFDLTNFNLFEKWKLDTVIIDSLWGGILLSLTTYIVYKIN